MSPPLAGDGDLSTIWHTEFVGASPGYPHELVIDLGSLREVEGLLYVPRQDSPNGRVKDFEVRTSTDGRAWSKRHRFGPMGKRHDVQICPAFRSAGPLRSASRLERGRRPAVHERGRSLRGITAVQAVHESRKKLRVRDNDCPVTRMPNGLTRGLCVQSNVSIDQAEREHDDRRAEQEGWNLGWFSELDPLLRGELTRVSSLRSGGLELNPGRLSIIIVVLAMIYGICMGTFAVFRPEGDRTPCRCWRAWSRCRCLFYLTLLVTFPSLYVFNALVGSRLSWERSCGCWWRRWA